MNDNKSTDRIEHRLEYLKSAVRELTITIENVTAMLSPVLRQPQPSVMGANETAKAQANTSSTINTMIAEETTGIWACIDKLRAVADSLDL